MPRKPYATVRHTRNGCIVTVHGQGYRIEAEWDGSTNQHGGCKFKAKLRADGFEDQSSFFALAPRQYPGDPNQVGDVACSLFSIGRGDVDDEFWTPHPEAHHDERWIGDEGSLARGLMSLDRETFERRAKRAA